MTFDLKQMTEKTIIEDYGWHGFLEHKVATWRATPDDFRSSCSLLTFIGMSTEEYSDWVINNVVADRVKRGWGHVR